MAGEDSLTYQQLDGRANHFAHHLRALGVGPEVIVGVCLERSVGGIISLLAVLKAGGAYLPLDPAYPAYPAYPAERLAYMLANAGAPLLITQPEAWPAGDTPGCRRVSYREHALNPAPSTTTTISAAAPPKDLADPATDPLAYVIYTSGSTGKPEGVAVAHASLCNLMRWHAAEFTLAVGARVIQSTPLSFDVSVQEVFGILTAGGTLVLVEGCLRRDPRGLRRFLAAERINRFFLTPVMLSQIAELPGPPLPDLRDVIAAGEQLADQEREILGQTLGRIRALRPSRVLEIGVGTGDFALALAPECADYLATDFSQAAIDYLAGLNTPKLRLLCWGADDFSGIEPASFDTVIIHSVSQYLPDAAYFRRMVEGAVRATRPGGYVYVGDLQDFSLITAHHTGEQARRAPASLPVAELRERIHRRVGNETQLMVGPGFFHALRDVLPAIGAVEMQLRRGRVLTEMTRMHYDATLRVGAGGPPEVEPARWLRWNDDGLTLASLRERLERERPEVLGARAVPNARLQWELAALACLDDPAPPATVGALRDAVEVALAARGPGVDPEDLWELGHAADYRTTVNWSAEASGADGCCEVVFQRIPGVARFPRLVATGWPESFANAPRRTLANDQAAPGRDDLPTALRSYLKETLPGYMVPAAFVTLERFPLTASGKVDRLALPAPVYLAANADPDDTAAVPRSLLEKRLAAIWERLLGVNDPGVSANFFELGGDSLLGLRVINQLRELLGEPLSLVLVFEAPTIALLAEKLEASYPAAVRRVCGLSGARRHAPDIFPETTITTGTPPPELVAVSRDARRVKRSALQPFSK